MKQKQKGSFDVNDSSPYKSTLTREQYLFYEMRTTANIPHTPPTRTTES